MALARSFISTLARSLSRARASAAALALLTLGAAALIAAPPQAAAQQSGRGGSGWNVCNETSYVLEAATGRPDGRAIVVQGWIRLRPGECRVGVGAPLARGTHYLYARTSSAHRGGRRQWIGDATLCVDPSTSFQIENPPQCAAMGLEERRFRRVQINKRDRWQTNFAETTTFSPARARAAGIQRLLQDAGYEVRTYRGNADPRAIATAVAQFRATARLAPNASEDQLIDALEVAARRRSDQVGLTLCNRTRGRVWTAMARRRGEGWESRGWWQLAPGGCVRTLDEPLMQDVYYVHASLDSEEGPRMLAASGEPFCTSPARFAILGRENCDARYYDTDIFAAISARDRDGLVVDFEDRDFLEPGERPRTIQSNNAVPDVTPDAGVRRGVDPAAAPSGPAAQTQDRAQDRRAPPATQ